jgi:hypothetical protein
MEECDDIDDPAKLPAEEIAELEAGLIRSRLTVRFKDIEADLPQLAGRLFKVSDAQGRPTFVGIRLIKLTGLIRNTGASGELCTFVT